MKLNVQISYINSQHKRMILKNQVLHFASYKVAHFTHLYNFLIVCPCLAF